MRYVKSETTVLAGEFKTGLQIRIKLVNMITDELLNVNTNICNESTHLPGTYFWNISNIDQNFISNITTPTSIMYMMFNLNNTLETFKGKFVLGGDMDKLLTISSIDNQVKTNNQIQSINQTELKTILNDQETGLPKLISGNSQTLSSLSNIGTKIDNNFALSNTNINNLKALALRRKITFATTL